MIFSFFRRWVLRDGNKVLQDYGSISESQQDATVAGTPRVGPEYFTLEPGDTKKVWDFEDDGEFAQMLIESTGLAYVVQRVDAPTSASDPTASGTSINHPKDAISCNMPFTIQGMTIPVAASSSNYASAAFHASVTAGRRYEVWVKNPSAEDDIEIMVLRTL